MKAVDCQILKKRKLDRLVVEVVVVIGRRMGLDKFFKYRSVHESWRHKTYCLSV